MAHIIEIEHPFFDTLEWNQMEIEMGIQTKIMTEVGLLKTF